MIDINFIQALRDKLKGGNTKSIHLNALPGRYATRLDLSNLNIIKPEFANEFLKLLFSKSCFEFNISFDSVNLSKTPPEVQKRLGILSKRLNSLNYENDDNYKEHGIKTFSFGYPLLVKPSKQDPRKIIKAPIFIWQLEIVKATNKVNTWSILRNKVRNSNGRISDEEIHSVGLNEVLLSYLKTDENIIIPQVNEELLEDAIIDQEELVDECYKIIKALNPNTNEEYINELINKQKEPIKNIPDSTTIDNISNNLPWIYFGGVFGLFRAQKESIIGDIDKILENYSDFQFDKLVVEQFPGTAHSAVQTDPSQQEILSTLNSKPRKIIQGPPGTGKSQTLTALITNALANNLKCLVVCEKKTALDIIKHNLEKESEQIGALAAVIEDINKDRDGIVNSVRDRHNNLSSYNNYNTANYDFLIQNLENKVGSYNNQHKQLDKKIFQGKRWTDLVGEFLKYESTAEIGEFKYKLDYKQFKFHEDENELFDFIEKIKTAQKLFYEIKDTNHPLNILSDKLFQNENSRVAQLKLEENYIFYTKEFCNIRAELILNVENYKKWLDNHYLNYYKSITNEIDSFSTFVSVSRNIYGDIFLKNDIFTKALTTILSIVSKKQKNIKCDRRLFIDSISKIKAIKQVYNYFEHNFIKIEKTVNFKYVIENIELLKKLANDWYDKIEGIKTTYLNNFESNNIHPEYSGLELHIKNIENLFDITNKSIYETNIFEKEFSPCHTHSERISTTNQIISSFNVINEHLKEFREYYAWRKFILELTDLQKNVIYSLIEIKSSNWIIQFKTWYFYWLLSINEHKDLPKNEDNLNEIINHKNDLRQVQKNNIVNDWSEKQHNAVRNAQRNGINIISLFNKRGARGEKRNSLRKIIRTDFNLFTSFYPVLLISPSVCGSIIPLKEGLFDVVIFDEASQLRIEDTFPALLRGKIKIISGDSQQMPPSNFFQGGNAILTPTDEDNEEDTYYQSENAKIKQNIDLADSESLLVYAENCNYEASFLKIHYRSQHPSLIEFSNHAFYGKRLIPMPAKQDYKPIEYIQVSGLYEDSVNFDEAKHVIDILLNKIKPLSNGKYPSVGIATFNLYQRNLILEEITKARQNPVIDKKLSLYGTDLFVKNLENIQGDERDIIILSTTFGKRKDGSFRQQFGPILQQNGFKLLNVIITRAKLKMFVCTSIPEERINEYSILLRENKNTGRGIFYAYLAYSKAISENNTEEQKEILKLLYNNCESRQYDSEYNLGSESPFEEEVFNRLVAKIGEDRIEQQYKIGGFRIDLVVKSKITMKPIIAIECDGAEYHSSNEAYAWDIFREGVITPYGLMFHRIWSTNWWYNAEKELNKLIAVINRFDKDEFEKINLSQNEASSKDILSSKYETLS
ncbi:AAA domain-containing protein [Alistipes sp. ZOR0009]|uniref:AAA domain-containing protein n=1 Tax=Alistipes sp. ZOR0009 TaxID=1339253 RepID=UPI0006472086|nr:AAA domain-containing protein [Alistipes sp. ZOR0009]